MGDEVTRLKCLIEFAVLKGNIQQQMKAVSDEANRAAAKTGKSFQNMGTTFQATEKKIKGETQTMGVFSTKMKDADGHVVTYTKSMRMMGGQFVDTGSKTKGMVTGMNQLATSSQKASKGVMSLASRALLTIPIWMALRTLFMSVFKVIGNMIKSFTELDKGMRKVMAVATYTGATQARVYAGLEQKAKQYYVTSSKGMKEITEAMYQIGTAGRSTEEIMLGFNHVLDLSIGTFGSVAQAGKTVSGIMNVFEKQLRKVGGASAQMQYVSDLLATAWKNNQIELSEMATAMQYLGSIGGALDISLEALIATSSVMSDAFLRGGKGGRLIARALIEITKSSDKLRNLGVIFDTYAPLDYYDVMNQIHAIYEKQGGSMSFLTDLIDVFGARGGRAVLSLMQQWEKFNEEISRTPEEIKGAANSLKKLAEGSWGPIIKRAWREAWKETSLGSGEGVGKKPIVDWLVGLDEKREKIKTFNTLIELMGDNFKTTKEEAILLANYIYDLTALSDTYYKILKVGNITGREVHDFRKQNQSDYLERSIKFTDELIEKNQSLFVIEAAIIEARKNAEFKGEPLPANLGQYTPSPTSKEMGTNAVEFLTEYVSEGKKIEDMNEGAIMSLAKMLNMEKEKLSVIKELFKILTQNVEIRAEETNELQLQQSLAVRKIQDATNLQKLKLEGANSVTLAEEKIKTSIDNYNFALTKSNLSEAEKKKFIVDSEKLLNGQVTNLEDMAIKLKEEKATWNFILILMKEMANLELKRLEVFGEINAKQREELDIANNLNIAKASGLLNAEQLIQYEIQLIDASTAAYEGKKKEIILEKLQNELVTTRIKQIAEYSDKLKTTFQEGFSDILMGESNFEDFFTELSTTMRRGFSDALSENLTEKLFDITGIGEIFGGLASKLKSGYDYHARLLRGVFQEDALRRGGVGGTVYAGGRGGGVIGQWMNTPIGGYSATYPGGYSYMSGIGGGAGGIGIGMSSDPRGRNLIGRTRGQAARAGAGGVMLGYSASQSISGGTGTGGPQAGIGSGLMAAGGAGVMMGIGFGGVAAGAATGIAAGSMGIMAGLTAIGPLGWIAIGAILIGTLFSSGVFGGADKEQETRETKETTKAITSRIDISNKELAWVNRNLVSLKQELTFIMQESYYFRERSETENFSIGSARGAA